MVLKMMSAGFLLCLLLPLVVSANSSTDLVDGMERVLSKKGVMDKLRLVREMAKEKKADITAACLDACRPDVDSSECPRICRALKKLMDLKAPARRKRNIVNKITGKIGNILNILESTGIFTFKTEQPLSS